jgi:hypothetical protein
MGVALALSTVVLMHFSQGDSITINYALRRTEIVRSFFGNLRTSPKFLAIILLYSAGLGVSSLAFRGAFSRSFTVDDLMTAITFALGFFVFMPGWLFIRAKTEKRTMTLSPAGISTEIGARRGHVSWSNVACVTHTSRHIFIIGSAGNAFFIPARAFREPDLKAEFMRQINTWWTKR